MIGVGAVAYVEAGRAFLVSSVGLVKRWGLVCFLLLLCSQAGLAQGGSYRCEVSVTDFNVDDKNILGNFTVNVGNSMLITKPFKLLDTNLFVNAGVLLTNDPPLVAGAQPSKMVLTLAISKRSYSAIEAEMRRADVITNARTTVSLKSFEKAEVETIYLGKREPVIITLECKK